MHGGIRIKAADDRLQSTQVFFLHSFSTLSLFMVFRSLTKSQGVFEEYMAEQGQNKGSDHERSQRPMTNYSPLPASLIPFRYISLAFSDSDFLLV